MAKKNPNPADIALWRLEQIEEALPKDVSHQARGDILRRISKTPVLWPSGKTKPVPLATAYRWLRNHLKGGLNALRPKRRSDLGVTRASLPDEVIREALRLLTGDPDISLTFLLALLRPLFPGVHIPRSTLQQRLSARPDYARIKRLRGYRKRRTRFVAKAPHHIWQTDAKGPVRVMLANGTTLTFHVMSIIDDATRAVLAAIVSLHADLGAAVRVFRLAATRWGLPTMLYADRASIFDSRSFRMGLAQLGSYRIPAKPRNPEARGKIEAYHRALVRWFFDRLKKQVVVDSNHVQQLLDGVIHAIYQTHKHRGIKLPPEVALAGRVSTRTVPPMQLVEAFFEEKRLKAHPKTGEVEVLGVTYLVPDELRGQRLTFLLDPANEVPPQLKHPTSALRVLLRRAAIGPEDLNAGEGVPPPVIRWGQGNLQAIYDNWQGQHRPLAEPGFGLPEIYTLLADAAGRPVPQSDAEAALIQRAYGAIGPLPKNATQDALTAITKQLGKNRPVKTYLDALVSRVRGFTKRQRS
jgi:putative transposase